jgi:Rad3-related DNA helicase
LIGLEIARNYSTYILTSEKSLQQQYEDDTTRFDEYSQVKSICGVDTYTCGVNDEKFSLGVCRSLNMSNGEAMKLPCADKCEYLQRWYAAKKADRTIMNYAYYLIQMNFVLANMEEKAPFQMRELVVCDEAHKLPDIIEGHFACTIDKKIIDKITRCFNTLRGHRMIDAPVDCQGLFNAINRVLDLPLGAAPTTHLDALRVLVSEYSYVLGQSNNIKESLGSRYLSKKTNVDDLRKMAKKLPKEVRALFSLADNIKDRHCKVQDYVDNIDNHGIDNLIVDGETDGSRTFHNLSDADLFQKHFAKFSQVRVYMSATLQPELLMKRWGIDKDKAHVLYIDSEWDDDKSRVVLCDTANMAYHNADNSIRDAVKKINLLLEKHKNERGVIHTTSNQIVEDVCSTVHVRHRDRLVRYASTKEKMEILADWDSYPEDAVLVGPSLTTGIDLKDDHARFNIVIKLSYPNMKSALWAKRSECLPHIYIGETASVLEQACGRTTRSKDDFSVSYVLDSRAEKFMLQHQRYFSPSFLERVRMEK